MQPESTESRVFSLNQNSRPYQQQYRESENKDFDCSPGTDGIEELAVAAGLFEVVVVIGASVTVVDTVVVVVVGTSVIVVAGVVDIGASVTVVDTVVVVVVGTSVVVVVADVVI